MKAETTTHTTRTVTVTMTETEAEVLYELSLCDITVPGLFRDNGRFASTGEVKSLLIAIQGPLRGFARGRKSVA